MKNWRCSLFIIWKANYLNLKKCGKKKKIKVSLGEFYDFHLQQRGAFVNYHLTDKNRGGQLILNFENNISHIISFHLCSCFQVLHN